MPRLGFGLGLSRFRSGGGSAPAYNPSTDIVGYQFSIDPSVIGTLFTDTAGTVAVTAPGDLVACVRDPFSGSIVATQATSGNRPTYQVDGDGFAYLQMGDGVTARWLNGNTINWATLSADRFTIIAALYNTGSTQARLFYSASGIAVGAFLLQMPESGTFGTVVTRLTSGTSQNTGGSFAANVKFTTASYGNGPSDILRIRRNGTQLSERTTDQGTGTYANGQCVIGASNTTGSNPYNGRLYGLIVAANSTTDYADADMALAEAYLEARLNF